MCPLPSLLRNENLLRRYGRVGLLVTILSFVVAVVFASQVTAEIAGLTDAISGWRVLLEGFMRGLLVTLVEH